MRGAANLHGHYQRQRRQWRDFTDADANRCVGRNACLHARSRSGLLRFGRRHLRRCTGGTTFTTNAVVADCTVIASFTLIPVNGACGSAISPPTGVAPSANLCSAGTASAVTPTVSQFTWSCAGVGTGTSASCAVGRTYTVTSSVSGGNGTITPTPTQTVASGATPAFTLAPAAGYSASVGGTCGGALVGRLSPPTPWSRTAR